MKKSYESLIQKRISVRSYDKNHPLNDSECIQIEQILSENSGEGCRFILVRESLAGVKLGTYGMISGAGSYIAGITASAEKEMVIEFGRRFEKIILELTELDLGTCWMAGTYSVSDFKSAVTLNDSERIVIVTPVGVPAEKVRIRDRLLQMVVKPRSRKPFEALFFDTSAERALAESDVPAYLPILEAVRQAPSASNKQPWRIIRVGERLHFYSIRDGISTLHGIFYGWNDLGIAKAHFELTAAERGVCGRWIIDDSAPSANGWEYCFSWDSAEKLS